MGKPRIKIPKTKGRVNRVTAIVNLFFRKGNGVTSQTMNKNYKTKPGFRSIVDEAVEEYNESMTPIAKRLSEKVKRAYDIQIEENKKLCGRYKVKPD